MIVLSIMVGMAALAWPNLRRPLADSTVQQAANLLRDQISICRQTAAVQGQPLLIRFGAGQSSIAWGRWEALISEQLEMRAAGGEEQDDLTIWQLPPDVVVDAVYRPDQPRGAPDGATDGSAELGLQAGTSAAAESPSGTLPPPQAAAGDDFQKWYLACLPDGQTQGSVIVLRDLLSGSRVSLEIDGVTGMMRSERMASVNSQDVAPQRVDPQITE